MNGRTVWIFVVFAALVLGAAYWWRNRPAPAPTSSSRSTATVPGTDAATKKKPRPEVAIQDGKTIDFSTGLAIVKDDTKQKAALDKALKEMDDAVRHVNFEPRTSAENKSADPSPPATPAKP